jgi:hypothetical protein
LIFAIGFSVALVGCDKDKDAIPAYKPPPGVTVTLIGAHLKPDGTLSPSGLEALKAHANDPIVNVIFVRSNLTDTGLAQLGQFRNIRLVNAGGSRITDKGIERLKKDVPEVEVAK